MINRNRQNTKKNKTISIKKVSKILEKLLKIS